MKNFEITVAVRDRARAILSQISSGFNQLWSAVKGGSLSGMAQGLTGLYFAGAAVANVFGTITGAIGRFLGGAAEYLAEAARIEQATTRLARTIGNFAAARAEAAALTGSPLKAQFDETELIAADNALRRMSKNALGGVRDLELLADVAIDCDTSLQSLAETVGMIAGRIMAGDESFGRYAMQLVQSRAVTADVVAEMERFIAEGRSAGDVVNYLFAQLQAQHGGAFAELTNDVDGFHRAMQAAIADANRGLATDLFPAIRDFWSGISAAFLTGAAEAVGAIRDAGAFIGRGFRRAPAEAPPVETGDRAAAVNAKRTAYVFDPEEIKTERKAMAEEDLRAKELEDRADELDREAREKAMSAAGREMSAGKRAQAARAIAQDPGASRLDRAKARVAYEQAAADERAARAEQIAEIKRTADEVAAARNAAREATETPEARLARIRGRMAFLESAATMAPGGAGKPEDVLAPAAAAEYYNLKRQETEAAKEITRTEQRKSADAAQDRAQEITKNAGTQREFAEEAGRRAADARARLADPTIAKREAEAAREKERENKHFSSMLRRAKAAGYEVVEGPGGLFDAVKKGSTGPKSKRLAEAMIADAKERFAKQQKAEADRLDREARQAAIESAKLLKQIETNTKQGPIS